jgi:broad specificity phosphatase PhoE
VRRALLARHGESEFSVRGALNGDVAVRGGLTPAGREQARRLGSELRDVRIDLCVTTEFERVLETADLVLDGRDVPRVVVPELNDPLYGPFEGAQIDEYRAWATSVGSAEAPGPGGESRRTIVERYVRGFRLVLDRDEETILVVAHSLPISYAVGARDGRAPSPRAPLAEYTTVYELSSDELERAARLLEQWAVAPSW